MRELRPGRRQEPRERGATDLPQELVDGRRQGQVAALGEPVEELRHKRLESMGADAATGLPQDRGRGGDLGPVATRAAARARLRSRPGHASQQPDSGFAVQAGNGHHLVQEPVLLEPARVLVPLTLNRGILPKAGSRHGHLLGGLGNRDF
jgi:hypothetical protein